MVTEDDNDDDDDDDDDTKSAYSFASTIATNYRNDPKNQTQKQYQMTVLETHTEDEEDDDEDDNDDDNDNSSVDENEGNGTQQQSKKKSLTEMAGVREGSLDQFMVKKEQQLQQQQSKPNNSSKSIVSEALSVGSWSTRLHQTRRANSQISQRGWVESIRRAVQSGMVGKDYRWDEELGWVNAQTGEMVDVDENGVPILGERNLFLHDDDDDEKKKKK